MSDVMVGAKYIMVAVLAALTCFSSEVACAQSNCKAPPVPFPDPPSSPQQDWKTERWEEWRDTEISKILQPTFPTQSGETFLCRDQVIARSAQSYAALQPILSSNPEFFSSNPELSRTMGNFVSFIESQSIMARTDASGKPTHNLGMDISDQEYVDLALPFTELPPLLKSNDFLRLMAAPGTYSAAAKLIEKQNETLPAESQWTVVPFRAQFIQSVDRTTYGRMLVFLPQQSAPGGGTVDKWVLFAIATPDTPQDQEIKSVSVFASHRKTPDATGTTTYAMDYMRTKDPTIGSISPIPVLKLPFDPSHTSKNCYDCHKAAVMPIHSKVEYEFDSTGKLREKASGSPSALTALNKLIEEYGLPDFAKQRFAAYGPSLGPVKNVNRTPELLHRVAGVTLPDSSVSKILGAMRCAKCHDDFAPINYPQAVQTNRDIQAFEGEIGLVQTMIEKGYMPPNNSLSDFERTVLWKALLAEYLDLLTTKGLFVDWLRGGANQDQHFRDSIYSEILASSPLRETDSEDSLREKMKLQEQFFGFADTRSLSTRRALAELLTKQKRYTEAESVLSHAGRPTSNSFRSVRDSLNPVSKDSARKNGQIQGAFTVEPGLSEKSQSDLPVHGF